MYIQELEVATTIYLLSIKSHGIFILKAGLQIA